MNEAQYPPVDLLENQLDHLKYTHNISLSDLLAAYGGCEFAGDIGHNEQGQSIHLGDVLPPYVIPMYAPFMPPYSEYFIAKLTKFKNYISERVPGDPNYAPFLIVPIRSNGGDITLLKDMLQSLEHFRSKYKIQIVVLISGMVASCGFILAQVADYLLCDTTGIMLCHEPSQTQGVSADPRDGVAHVTSTTESARSTYVSLKCTQKDIYSHAEIGILMRHMKTLSSDKGDWINASHRLLDALIDNKDIIHEWRKSWYETHKNSLSAMHKENTDSTLSWDEDNRENILKYITEKVVDNRHDFVINRHWMTKLNLVDKVNADIEIARTDGMKLVYNDRQTAVDVVSHMEYENNNAERLSAPPVKLPAVLSPQVAPQPQAPPAAP